MQNEVRPIEYEINVSQAGKANQHFYCPAGMNLLTVLQQQGISIDTVCGGRGSCGKCKVLVLDGQIDISPGDRKHFSGKELDQGWRLACKAFPKGNCTVRLAGEDSEFDVVTEQNQSSKTSGEELQDDYAIAIDIGTTTIALSLIELTSGLTMSTYSSVNSQRAYGADVISRIQASNNGMKELLRDSIRRDLLQGIREVVTGAGIEESNVQKIVIACNTTMGHLLLGYSCETLGRYPYTPVNINTVQLSFSEIFGTGNLMIPVIILPGISAYVGGDIVSGLLACDFDRVENPCLFIDLGTNGEMAIGNKDRVLVSSAAAGPAFEGGNISCGIGSIAGAIYSLEINNNGISYQTIRNKPPVGICGTGIIELASELLKAGFIDETGLLNDEYFEEGYKIADDLEGKAIIFTQKDVREIQLAKAAVRAGIEVLVKQYGITYDKIDKVYLAGGFGYKMNLEKAVHIGLLPGELSSKILQVGNSALGGAVRALLEPQAAIRIENIRKASAETYLSRHEDFGLFYLKYMDF